MCECVWRSTIYPVGIGKVDQCMFFSSFTHLPTVTTTTPLTPEAHTPTHAHQGCKSLPQGAQGPHWTPRAGSVPENISPQSHSSQQGRTLVLSLPWTHKGSHTWKETLGNTNYCRAPHNKNCLFINRLWLQGISPSISLSLSDVIRASCFKAHHSLCIVYYPCTRCSLIIAITHCDSFYTAELHKGDKRCK